MIQWKCEEQKGCRDVIWFVVVVCEVFLSVGHMNEIRLKVGLYSTIAMV